jgi:hypothetical protein
MRMSLAIVLPVASRWSTIPLRLAVVTAFCVLAAPAASAQDGPAFGDSGWVAPLPPGALEGDPTEPGSRVAGEDHEPVGESILRAPFRIAAFPLRLFALGVEELAGVAGPIVAPRTEHGRVPGNTLTIGPTASYSGSAGPGIGVAAVKWFDRDAGARLGMSGTWSLRDNRRVRADLRYGAPEAMWGVGLRAGYSFRPNRKFYGIGNFSQKDDRSIFLNETGDAELSLRLGPWDRQIRLLGGFASTSARRGYNDSPGLLDQLAPAEVPGMLDETQVLTYGVGGDLAALDDGRDPSLGVHGRAELRQVRSAGDGDLDYRRLHLEARAYVPVFSSRRVIALRAVHQSVDPADGSSPIPFFHLPESGDQTRFAGYAAHRFADAHLAIGHAEYRWIIWDRLWALALAEVGEVAPSAGALRLRDVHESYGGGLRYAFSERAVVRVSVAKGSEGLVAYLTLKEDF